MATDRDNFISSSLQLGNVSSRADTYGRPDGLRAPARTSTTTEQVASAAAATVPPPIVTVIGIYELCRAVIVGAVFAMFMTNPGAHLESRTFWQIFFIVSNGSVGVSLFTVITFCYGLAIGLALFFRVDWGRRILIGTSIYSVLRLVRFLAGYSILSARLASDPAKAAGLEFVKEGIYMLVAVNVAIGLCMAYGTGVAEWFRKRT